MTRLARLLIRLSSAVVPSDARREWTELWLGELWALQAGTGATRRDLLTFAAGAPRAALVEAFDGWRVTGLHRDVLAAARRLVHAPVFSAVCIVVIAVGVAATAAIFSVVNATLLRTPPAIHGGARLVQVGRAKASGAFDTLSYPAFEDIRRADIGLASIAAYSGERVLLDDGDGRLRLGAAQLVTSGYFETLRAPLSIGREFTAVEARDGGAVCVISADLWRARFGGDPSVTGRTLRVGGAAMAIVGVAPDGFVGADIGDVAPEVWLPMGAGGADDRARLQDRRRSWIWAFGRLRDGVSIDQARARIASVHAAIEAAHPGTMGAGLAVAPGVGLRPDDRREARGIMLVMMASVAIVLAIVCANVASLTLARAAGRRREIALRLALGASRFRLSRELLAESLVLALCAGAASAAVTRWTAAGIRGLMPYDLAVGFEPDATVFGFTLACAVLTGVVIGMLPARRAARTDLMTVMREGPDARSSARAREVLLVLQLALSFALTVGTVLLVRSLVKAQHAVPGFDPDGVITVTLSPGLAGWSDGRTDAFVETALARIRALPGVASAGAARGVPIADALARRSVSAGGLEIVPHGEPLVAAWNAVDPAYFTVMRLPILAGRPFAAEDARGADTVAILSESLARRLFGDDDPIGRTLHAGFDRVRVIGIARDAAVRSLNDRAASALYTPLAQQPAGTLTLMVRGAAGSSPDPLAAPVRAAVEELAPGLPVLRAAPLRRLIASSLQETRLTATLLSMYGGVALLLSSVGLYALQLHLMRLRRREMGVRLALGASPAALQRDALSGAARVLALGIALGLGVSWLTGRLIQRMLFGIGPFDAVSLAAAAAIFLACGTAAAAGPARAAAASDPMASLGPDPS